MALSDLTSDGSELGSIDNQSQDESGQEDVPLKKTKFADILARRRNFAISNRLHNTGLRLIHVFRSNLADFHHFRIS